MIRAACCVLVALVLGVCGAVVAAAEWAAGERMEGGE